MASASIQVRTRTGGEPVFDVRFRMNGKSRQRSFTTLRGAEKWQSLLELVGPIEALATLDRQTVVGITVDDLAERFISSKTGVEPKTIQDYWMYMRTSISPFLGKIPAELVTRERVTEWVKFEEGSGRSGKTIANRYGFLASMYRYAVLEGIVSVNPCVNIRLPESERKDIVWLSPADFQVLMRYIPSSDRPLVMFLASTGLRWGEVTALRPGDIDLEAHTVSIARAWKRSKTRGWYLGPPKTKKARRTIPFPAELVPIIEPLMDSGTEFVFTNTKGDPVREQRFHEWVWHPALNLANGKPAFPHARGNKDRAYTPRKGGPWDVAPATRPLRKHPRVHDLRHSHASWLIAAGTPLTVIQYRLGHESIKTTSDTYGHIGELHAKAAAAATSAALGGVFAQLSDEASQK